MTEAEALILAFTLIASTIISLLIVALVLIVARIGFEAFDCALLDEMDRDREARQDRLDLARERGERVR